MQNENGNPVQNISDERMLVAKAEKMSREGCADGWRFTRDRWGGHKRLQAASERRRHVIQLNL
jgi:hypothetical protein